jgi:lysozyme
MNDAPIFTAVRKIVRRHSKNQLEGLAQIDVDELNEALKIARGAHHEPAGPQTLSIAVPAPGGQLRASDKGLALIHSFEQCRLEAYPDPGSRDGTPWTIGWGSTGPGIARGTVWTQAQADERFKQDISGREAKLRAILASSPTTQAQFDALLSLGYNIGMDALAGSTVMRRHRAGDYAGAANAFAMWNKNDGKVMRGLVRRREAEAAMYRGRA